jgi:hypothetical protein
MHAFGKAKLGGHNVGQLNNPIIPKEEDATSSANSRMRSKALKPIPSNVGSIK